MDSPETKHSLKNGKPSPESPPNTSDEASCCDVAVTVDDVDAGDDATSSLAGVHVLDRSCSAVSEGDGTKEGSSLLLEGLLPVTGLHTPELSSGQRKTSIGPCVLFSDTW